MRKPEKLPKPYLIRLIERILRLLIVFFLCAQSLDVMRRYGKEGAQVYNTGLNGNLLLVSNGSDCTAHPDKVLQNITQR